MLNAPMRVMIVAALCALGLIGLVVREGYERSRPPTVNAHDIVMQMQAIDPRALLTGHYVIVGLQTRIVTPADVAPCEPFAAIADDESWVALAYQGPEFRIPPGPGSPPIPYAPVGVATSRQAAQAIADRIGGRGRGLAARGSASCTELEDAVGPERARMATVQTQLAGVQRFYAPQADAERIDALMREQSANDQATVFAIVNIGRDGRARLKGLSVNGEVIELNWL